MEDFDLRREGARCRVFLRFVGDDGDLAHALGAELIGDDGHVQRPIDRLAAGHGHGIVVEQLVGDVHIGGHGGADRQAA